MHGTDQRMPNLRGPASIVYDGKYIWIGNRSTFGEDTDVRNKYVWVIDPSPGVPRVIQRIDLSSFAFKVVRSLNMSSDGTKVYVCTAGTAGVAGSCLIIDKNTFQIVGNARVTTSNIGGPQFFPGGRAVFALDDGANHLWVVNSNQSNGNAVERFSLSAVLANGATPTSSVQVVNVTQPFHAEELALLSGFLWTSTSDYSTGVSRIDPTTGAITNNNTTHLIWGARAFNGALWAGDFNRGLSRMDPANFGSAGFETDFINLYPIQSGSNSTTLNAIAYDGNNIYACASFYNRSTAIASGSNGNILPQSTINVLDTTLFPSSGALIINSSSGLNTVFYTGKTPTSFTGCSGGAGTIFTGNSVKDRRQTIKKLSTGAGSVAIVGSIEVYNATYFDNGQGLYDLKYDGTYLWAAQRVLSGLLGIFKIDPVTGTTQLVWPTGGQQSDNNLP